MADNESSEGLDLTPKDCAECGKKTTGGIFCSVECWFKPRKVEVKTRCPNGLPEYDCWYCEEAKERYSVSSIEQIKNSIGKG